MMIAAIVMIATSAASSAQSVIPPAAVQSSELRTIFRYAVRRRGFFLIAQQLSSSLIAISNEPMSRRDELIALLANRSAKRGSFTLASGRQSTLYIDARVTTMSPDGLALIGPLGVA